MNAVSTVVKRRSLRRILIPLMLLSLVLLINALLPSQHSYAKPPGSYYVDTISNAPGYADATTQSQWVGTLNGGTNYVFCKVWGGYVSLKPGQYNHWWLWTDLDSGGKGWVSAYYLSRWGNDVAKDNNGNWIPSCSDHRAV